MTAACEICGAEFTPRNTQIRNGGGRFCSRKCSGRANAAKYAVARAAVAGGGLNQDEVRRQLDYDPETGLLTRRIGRKNWIGKVAGYLAKDGYVMARVCGRHYMAHRLVWLHVHGRWPKKYIDHINGNRGDNRIANLRECNNSQNQANRRPSPGRTYKGVTFSKHTGKFFAQIASKYISSHSTDEEAARAYDAAAKARYGCFALLNFSEAEPCR